MSKAQRLQQWCETFGIDPKEKSEKNLAILHTFKNMIKAGEKFDYVLRIRELIGDRINPLPVFDQISICLDCLAFQQEELIAYQKEMMKEIEKGLTLQNKG